MARFAIVKDGQVINVVEARRAADVAADGAEVKALSATDKAEPGGTFEAGVYKSKPVVVDPLPAEYAAALTDRDRISILARRTGLA